MEANMAQTRNWQKGALIIPPHANIEDGTIYEPARIEKTTYLLGSTPAHSYEEYNWNELEARKPLIKIPDSVTVKLNNGGEEDLIILKKISQKDKKEALVKDSQRNNHYVNATLFTRLKKEQGDSKPEDSGGIKLEQSGILFKPHVKLNEELYVPFQGTIFPAAPARTDIVQNNYADCFLLASLSALVTKDPSLITGMMQQQDDDTTIVRLFKPNRNGAPTPIYIRVKNDYHVMDESIPKHTQPWVHIIEKAYAALGIIGHTESAKQVSTGAMSSMYGFGGHADLALTILTGKPAEHFTIGFNFWDTLSKIDEVKTKWDMLLLQANSNNPNAAQKFKNDTIKLFADDDLMKLLRHNVYQLLYLIACAEDPKVKEFLESISKDPSPQQIKQAFYKLKEATRKIDIVINEKWLQAINLPKPNWSRLLFGIENNIISALPDDRVYSGKYTEKELNAFADFKARFHKGNAIIAGTRSILPKNSVGLANRHAYSVVKITEDLNSKPMLLKITLRNPWGHMGRTYQSNKKGHIPKSSESPEFEIDFKDFYKFFDTYAVGDIPVIAPEVDTLISTKNIASTIHYLKTTLIIFMDSNLTQQGSGGR